MSFILHLVCSAVPAPLPWLSLPAAEGAPVAAFWDLGFAAEFPELAVPAVPAPRAGCCLCAPARAAIPAQGWVPSVPCQDTQSGLRELSSHFFSFSNLELAGVSRGQCQQ